MSTLTQVATNAAALRNLAARLERLGYTGDCHAEAEHIALNLLADGYRRLEPPPTPRGPGCTDAARQAAMDTVRAAIRDARNKHTSPRGTQPAATSPDGPDSQGWQQ